jgi:hypothetical protein
MVHPKLKDLLQFITPTFGEKSVGGIVFVTLFVISQFSFLTNAEAQQSGEQPLPFESVRLGIDFDPELFDSSIDSVRQEQFQTACKVWKEAFLHGQGPWGFGIASEVNCRMKVAGEVEDFRQLRKFDEWILTLRRDKLDNSDVIRAEICRARQLSDKGPSGEPLLEEKCEAQKLIPWTEYRVRLLRFRSFVRLLAASLYDQLPFLSSVTRNLIQFDQFGLRGYAEVGTPEVSFPPPPSQLSFVEARFEQSESRFRLREISQREAMMCANKSKSICWIVNKNGRGKRTEEFNTRLREAFVILTAQFQFDVMRFERERIKEDVEKLKEKSSVFLFFRGGAVAGIPVLSLRSSYGGSGTLGLRTGAGFGVLSHAVYVQSQYVLETEVEEKNSGSSIIESKIGMREMGFWIEPELRRSFSANLNPEFVYHLGARLGVLASDGDFKSAVGLPQGDLQIRAREFVLGGSLGTTVPLGQHFLFSAAAQGELGLTAKSSTIFGSAELVWIVSRMQTQFVGRRPASLKVGTGVQFGSLGRLFVNSDSAKALQTEVTLNGFHSSVFIEKVF